MTERGVNFLRVYIDFLKQLNLYLNHFPKFEKYALSQEIRKNAYEVYDYMVEGQKRYHKKTSLTSLDISFEQLKSKIFLAYELGYFIFKDGKNDSNSDVDAERRYAVLTLKLEKIGKMVGGWIKKAKEDNHW
jgi:hypothetical protein